MPHYFFHIRTAGDLVKDEEGLILRNLVEAREEVISAARDVVGECLRAESPIAVGNAVEVEDEGGAAVLIVEFAEAIPVENDNDQLPNHLSIAVAGLIRAAVARSACAYALKALQNEKA